MTDAQLKGKAFFTQRYLYPARDLVAQVLGGLKADEALVCRVAGITPEKLAEAHTILTPPKRGMMMGKGAAKPAEYTPEQKREAQLIAEVERTLTNVVQYKKALEESPELEMRSMLNVLAGGYVAPTSGGDAVANPQAVPTGRNLFPSMPRPRLLNRLGPKARNWPKTRWTSIRRPTVTIRARSAIRFGAANSSKAKALRSPRCSICWVWSPCGTPMDAYPSCA